MNIPLLSRGKKQEIQEQVQEQQMVGEEEAPYPEEEIDLGIEPSDRTEELIIRSGPMPEDMVQLWGRVFEPFQMENSPMSKKILPSLATSNYPLVITLEREIYPLINRIIYMEIGILQQWANTNQIFDKHIDEEITKLDVDARTRLSIGMEGLKEVQTRRGDIKREQKKPVDEKLGVRR